MSAYEMRADGLYCEGTLVSKNLNPKDAAWDQGIRQFVGYYDQPESDVIGCQRCGYSYLVRREFKFVGGALGMLGERIKAADPGCPKCSGV